MRPGLGHFTHLCGLGQLPTRVSSSDHVSFTAGTCWCSQMAGHLRLGPWKAPKVEVCWDFSLDAGWVPGAGSDVVVGLLLANGGVTTPLAVPLGDSASTRRSSPSWSRSLGAGPLELESGGCSWWPDTSGPPTQRLLEQTTAARKQNT